ncbi:MAG: UDP-N-acetylmuramoyl-tripeptide--D-alanyl-D-alanine ligase [Lachnospiraceae bacterium]|nr:UDP-N-acetylmuramoyl-tripeptide--D-alanyl-D-alanine ligase [Lachnospiraceae bacterium]
MKPVSIAEIVEAVSGTLAWGDEKALVTSVVTDSREVKEGSLFVPLIGERVDAHRFIPGVLEEGAACVFSSDHTIQEERGAGIYVTDTLQALQALAAWYRSQFSLPVIGITGSVGKTTTKEMIGAVLETKYRTVKTLQNLNSQIGVALMQFQLEEDTEMAVFEMGISMPGEMERLAVMARPNCAVLTNVGVSHIGNLGSRENICTEKGKIITGFDKEGTVYICGNGDLKELSRENLPYEQCPGRCETRFYGTEPGCLYYGDEIQTGEQGQSFLFHYPEGEMRIELSVMGLHNINNAIVALALALEYQVPLSDAARALKEYRPIAMRGVVKERDGVHIIDDTYNASPDSINSNLDALFDYGGKDSRKIAVLADVLELGERSRELHEGVGKFILQEREKGKTLSFLVTVGTEAGYISDYVTGHSDIPARHCKSNEEVAAVVRETMRAGDWILVKGSRGMKMDEVVERLIKG